MTTEEAIIERLKVLPDVARREVLDFAELLATRAQERAARDEEIQWSDLSLAAAMRGMEDEPAAPPGGQDRAIGPTRQPGSAKGKLRILAEDDEHLDDFKDYVP